MQIIDINLLGVYEKGILRATYCPSIAGTIAARNVGIISTVSDIRELAMGLDVGHFNWDRRGDVVEEGSDAWIIRIRVASLAKIK